MNSDTEEVGSTKPECIIVIAESFKDNEMIVPWEEMGPISVDIRICLIMILEIVDWEHMYLVDSSISPPSSRVLCK